jgi:predicted DNA-binding ribbon-helix-helix protein
LVAGSHVIGVATPDAVVEACAVREPLLGGGLMKRPLLQSRVVKRSVIIAGRKTSVSMDNEFWSAFQGIARERGLTVTSLISSIDADRKSLNLSLTIRVFVLEYYRDRANMNSTRISRSSSRGL